MILKKKKIKTQKIEIRIDSSIGRYINAVWAVRTGPIDEWGTVAHLPLLNYPLIINIVVYILFRIILKFKINKPHINL